MERIEAVVDMASHEHEDSNSVQGPSSPVLTDEDFAYLANVRDLGGTATFDETNATTESLARLTKAGLLTGRIGEQGITVLALTGATDRDVWVAANRQECDDLADQFLADIVKCETIAEGVLGRIGRLGGNCDEQALVESLSEEHPKEAVEAVVTELARRGAVKRALHNISGYTLIASTEEPANGTSASFANTLKGLLKLDADSARNQRFSWKTFADEASGRRPDDDEAQDRFAYERAANEFRAAARKAKETAEKTKLSAAEIARKMLTSLENGLDTFRNLARGGNEDVRVKAAVLDRLQEKNLIVETEYNGEVAYTITRPTAPTKGVTIPQSAQRKAYNRARRDERTRQAFQTALQETSRERIAWSTARAAFLAEATLSEKVVIRLLKEGTIRLDSIYAQCPAELSEELPEILQTMGETGLIKRSKACTSGDLYISIAGDWAEKSARNILGKRLLHIIADPDSGITVPEGTRLAAKVREATEMKSGENETPGPELEMAA